MTALHVRFLILWCMQVGASWTNMPVITQVSEPDTSAQTTTIVSSSTSHCTSTISLAISSAFFITAIGEADDTTTTKDIVFTVLTTSISTLTVTASNTRTGPSSQTKTKLSLNSLTALSSKLVVRKRDASPISIAESAQLSGTRGTTLKEASVVLGNQSDHIHSEDLDRKTKDHNQSGTGNVVALKFPTASQSCDIYFDYYYVWESLPNTEFVDVRTVVSTYFVPYTILLVSTITVPGGNDLGDDPSLPKSTNTGKSVPINFQPTGTAATRTLDSPWLVVTPGPKHSNSLTRTPITKSFDDNIPVTLPSQDLLRNPGTRHSASQGAAGDDSPLMPNQPSPQLPAEDIRIQLPGGMQLAPGEVIKFEDHTISLSSDGRAVLVNGKEVANFLPIRIPSIHSQSPNSETVQAWAIQLPDGKYIIVGSAEVLAEHDIEIMPGGADGGEAKERKHNAGGNPVAVINGTKAVELGEPTPAITGPEAGVTGIFYGNSSANSTGFQEQFEGAAWRGGEFMVNTLGSGWLMLLAISFLMLL